MIWPRSARPIDPARPILPFMQRTSLSRNQNQTTVTVSRSPAVADFNQNEVDFAPSADEVARRAYFSYVNEGSRPGRDVQHWLEAEAQLLAERNLTRIHGFHSRT
jgi:hypothetical protein